MVNYKSIYDLEISYHEFLKHKDNIENYLKELFDRLPNTKLYFPINLTSEERHLIYSKSKGYVFEKLHKFGSKYSIKLWKPEEEIEESEEETCEEDKVEVEAEREDKTTEEENEAAERLAARERQRLAYEKEDEEDEEDEEDDDYEDTTLDEIKYDLMEMSSKINCNHEETMHLLMKCNNKMSNLLCIFGTIMFFNFVGSCLFLTQFFVPPSKLVIF